MVETTVTIDGMMCGHCEAHVNDTVRANFNVKKVTSNHSKDTTVIISEEPISEEAIKAALDPTGYKVLSVSVADVEDKKKGLFGFMK